MDVLVQVIVAAVVIIQCNRGRDIVQDISTFYLSLSVLFIWDDVFNKVAHSVCLLFLRIFFAFLHPKTDQHAGLSIVDDVSRGKNYGREDDMTHVVIYILYFVYFPPSPSQWQSTSTWDFLSYFLESDNSHFFNSILIFYKLYPNCVKLLFNVFGSFCMNDVDSGVLCF